MELLTFLRVKESFDWWIDVADAMLTINSGSRADVCVTRYHCFTCGMVDGVGVCSVCAKVCHKDHDLVYAKFGSFFCDCGAKDDNSCLVR